MNQSIFSEAFFDLKTRLAGEILQKYINYHVKVAIIGDFSVYRAKACKISYMNAIRGTTSFLAD